MKLITNRKINKRTGYVPFLAVGFALALVSACGPLPSLDLFFNHDDTDSAADCEERAFNQCMDGDVFEFTGCDLTPSLISDCHDTRADCLNIDASDAHCLCRDGWTGEDCAQCLRYVAEDSPAQNPEGRSWSDAFSSIQEALDSASSHIASDHTVEACQIWVKGGTYYAWQVSQTDSIHLQSGVELLGGFAGDEAHADERDWQQYPTTISGENPQSSADRVCHVLVGADDATLDGFTISGGEAICAVPVLGHFGGGMLNSYSSPTIRNCLFTDNHAYFDGGAIYNRNSATVIEDSTFESNTADGYGGAISNLNSSPSIERCQLTNNTTAAVNNVQSSPVIKGTTFSGTGCQVRNYDSSAAVIQSSHFSQVQLGHGDQVIFAHGGSDITIQNCVFTDIIDVSTNSWEYFYVVYNDFSDIKISNSTFLNTDASKDLVISNSFSSPAIINTIIWGNTTRDFVNTNGSNPTVSYSLITDLTDYSDPTNFTDDPLFVSDVDGDVHLQEGSPCIDRADGDAAPEFDIGGTPRFDEPGIEDLGTGMPTFADVGAYEYAP